MKNHENKQEHHHHKHKSDSRTALSATLHCLIGCGTGEVLGVLIGVALGLTAWISLALGVVLGFVFGFALGIIPLIKRGFEFKKAFKIIFLAEFISIAVMETTEVLIEIYVAGVGSTGLDNPIFWIGMFLALVGGFIITYPVNYFMVKKGVRHIH